MLHNEDKNCDSVLEKNKDYIIDKNVSQRQLEGVTNVQEMLKVF
jgi:hypothetical protein